MPKAEVNQLLGKLRGHVSEAKGRAAADAAQRKAAEKTPRSIILGKNDVQGEYDAHRVLTTTLGGGLRAMTSDDLATFRRNMKLAQKNFHGDGITAWQVIDLASSRPLKYIQSSDAVSDIDRARREITMAVPVSAIVTPQNALDVRLITNAGPDSKVNRHHVLVRFNTFAEAANKLMAAKTKDRQSPKQAANWLRKQKLAFDCDCERHRYFLRYVATIGNFNAGRPEHGFPKIRNPELKGVACKHVLRVMAEVENSAPVLAFLTKQMERVLKSADNTARTQQTQLEADKLAQRQSVKPSAINSSEQRAKERAAAREKSAFQQSAKAAERSQKKSAATRKVEAAIAAGGLSIKDLAAFRRFGFTDAQIATKLKQ